MAARVKIGGCTRESPSGIKQPKRGKRAELITISPDPLPHWFQQTPSLTKLTPAKLFAPTGDTVAWEHHLRVPLRCRNFEFGTPHGEKNIADALYFCIHGHDNLLSARPSSSRRRGKPSSPLATIVTTETINASSAFFSSLIHRFEGGEGADNDNDSTPVRQCKWLWLQRRQWRQHISHDDTTQRPRQRRHHWWQ